jgi:hypothetical protein
MKTEDLFADPTIGGAIPTVFKDRIVFAGFGPDEESRTPDLMMYRPGDSAPLKLLQTPYEEWRPVVASDGQYTIMWFEGKRLVKRRQKERISRRCGNGVSD